MKSNTAQLKIAEKYLGDSCPACCSMGNNCCCYFVSMIFRKADNAMLFYNGVTVTYCPNAIKWCKANLAQIPIYLAMPGDVIYFDWNGNNVPDHIGFVDHRISDQAIRTLEGNTTSRYVVAYQTRPEKYVLGVFRPHFTAKFDVTKELEIDGAFEYNSIACLQKALGCKVDGILGKDTVRKLQAKVGVTRDGSWGKATSKAVQKALCGFSGKDVDGEFGEKSVKALQRWINKQLFKTTKTPTKKPVTKPQSSVAPSVKPTVTPTKKPEAPKKEETVKKPTWQEKATAYAREIANDGLYHYVKYSSDERTHKCPVCKGLEKILRGLPKEVVKAGTEDKSVKYLKKFLNWDLGLKLDTDDDKCDTATVKAIKKFQKRYHLKVDGIFGEQSRKKAKAVLKKFMGWNCIGFAFSCWHNGGDIDCRCNCNAMTDQLYMKAFNAKSDAEANKIVSDRLGVKVKVLRNGGKPIPLSWLKEGDIVQLFVGNTYNHTEYCEGNGKFADCTSGRKPNIKADHKLSAKSQKQLKMAIRYIGE